MHGTNQLIKECIDLRACAYSNWYRMFQKITPDSICIPLSRPIVDYLLDEIIILPKECYATDDIDADKTNNDDSEDEEDPIVVIQNARI